MAERLTPAARQLADTDWHLPLVYDLEGLDATILVATHSRLVIDLNRPPDDENLYPGRDTTGLIPVDTFHKEPVYREKAGRCRNRGAPAGLLAALPPGAGGGVGQVAAAPSPGGPLGRAFHRLGTASILQRSPHRPQLRHGRRKQLRAGADRGVPGAGAGHSSDYSWVLNGRFKGGYITRRYGEPAMGVHAVQLEMTQVIYMDEKPPFLPAAGPLRSDLAPLLRQCVAAAANGPEPASSRFDPRITRWRHDAALANQGRKPVTASGRFHDPRGDTPCITRRLS